MFVNIVCLIIHLAAQQNHYSVHKKNCSFTTYESSRSFIFRMYGLEKKCFDNFNFKYTLNIKILNIKYKNVTV